MKKILEFQQDIKAYCKALYEQEQGTVSIKFRLFELKANDTANIDIVISKANEVIAHLRGSVSYIDGKLYMKNAINLTGSFGAQP